MDGKRDGIILAAAGRHAACGWQDPALAERPSDPTGLAALAVALADRLARTGGPAEVAASAWLADQLAARAPALAERPPPGGGDGHRCAWGEGPVLRGRVIRAGRVLLAWDQHRLARQAGVSVAAVRELEAGRIAGRGLSAVATQGALEQAGVRFLAEDAGLGRGLRYASAGA